MAEIIANDLGRFGDSITEFGNACTALEKDFSEVVRHMEGLNAMWSGEAHDALLKRFKEDQANARKIIDFMKEILEDLNYAQTQYRGCENTVGSIVDSIKV